MKNLLMSAVFITGSVSVFSNELPKYQEANIEHPLYPVTLPAQEGYLQVSSLHSLYYATYGNPSGIPVIVLHGGPGAGCSDAMTKYFDLSRWQVVMFDQRGAPRSKPFGCLEENSPQHSIEDIEALREHLGIEKWMVFGGSWGATLAVLYGQEHPDRCLGFVVRGICLAREQDWHHLFYGMGKIFPEAYDAFVKFIPEEERSDLPTAYLKRVMDPDPSIHMPAARAFAKFPTVAGNHSPDPTALEKLMTNDKIVLSMSKAFLFYCSKQFFLEPDQILSNMDKISHLPAIIIHGRWDAVCLPEMSFLLHQKWQNSSLWMIPSGGHSAHEEAIEKALAKATDAFAEKSKK
jgi:proline iminopeptidase